MAKKIIKTVLSAVGLAAICMGSATLPSCTDSTIVNQFEESVSLEEAMASIDRMSEDFLKTHQATPGTRSIFSRLWRAVVADVRSIFHYDLRHNTPNVTIPLEETATASSKAFNELESVVPVYSDYTVGQQCTIDSLENVYKCPPNGYTIAKAHNAAIIKMIKKNQWNPENTVQTIKSLTEIATELGIATTGRPTHEIASDVDRFMIEYKKYNENTQKSDNNDNSLTTADQISDKLFNKYLEFSQTFSDPSDVESFTQSYILSIQRTRIPDYTQQDKEHISQLLRLASASYDLWFHITMLNQ